MLLLKPVSVILIRYLLGKLTTQRSSNVAALIITIGVIDLLVAETASTKVISLRLLV